MFEPSKAKTNKKQVTFDSGSDEEDQPAAAPKSARGRGKTKKTQGVQTVKTRTIAKIIIPGKSELANDATKDTVEDKQSAEKPQTAPRSRSKRNRVPPKAL